MAADRTNANTYHAHDHSVEHDALAHYHQLAREVFPHFFPGQPVPEVRRVPAGHGYTYTMGTTDPATGRWSAIPVLDASPHWFSDIAHRFGAKRDRHGQSPRWEGEEATLHEWGFEVGGAQNENQAMGWENRIRHWLNQRRGLVKRKKK